MLAEIVFCTAIGVYFEARSESLIGQLLVAEVIQNRVKSKKFPNNTCKVVTQKKQFSFFNNYKPKDIKKLKMYEKNAWKQAVSLSTTLIDKKVTYGVGCHYHAVNVNPKWSKKLEKVLVEGNHVFYKGGC